MNSYTNKRWFGTIILLALAVRLIIFGVVAQQPLKYYSDSDAYNYQQIAVNLVQHHTFSSDEKPPLTPDIYRTPIYPAALAVIFTIPYQSIITVVILQILLGSLGAGLTLLMSVHLNLPVRSGIIAALLVVFDPLTVLTTYQLLTETLFTTVLLLGLIALTDHWNNSKIEPLVLASVLLATATLIRPIGQFLPLALIPVFILVQSQKHQSWKQALFQLLIFLIINLLLVQSWAFRNYQEAGIWTISAISEKNLLYYRARDVIASANGISQDEANRELDEYIQTQVAMNNLTEAQSIKLMRNKALGVFQQYPEQTLKVHITGLAKVLINPGLDLICIMLNRQNDLAGCPGDSTVNYISGIKTKFAYMDNIQKMVAIWSIILLLAIYGSIPFGIWGLIGQNRIALILLSILITYFALLSAGGESVSRFRIPFMPFLGIIASEGIVNVFKFLKQLRIPSST